MARCVVAAPPSVQGPAEHLDILGTTVSGLHGLHGYAWGWGERPCTVCLPGLPSQRFRSPWRARCGCSLRMRSWLRRRPRLRQRRLRWRLRRPPSALQLLQARQLHQQPRVARMVTAVSSTPEQSIGIHRPRGGSTVPRSRSESAFHKSKTNTTNSRTALAALLEPQPPLRSSKCAAVSGCPLRRRGRSR
jgi:hypothetical protein